MQIGDLEESDVILDIFINGQTYHSVAWPDVRQIVDEVFGEFREGSDLTTGLVSEEVIVQFTLSSGRVNRVEAPQDFDSYLQVAVNQRTRYGALKWLVSSSSALSIDASIAEHVWISDNPNPPDADPFVISDPDLPRYHNPRSTLPISAVRAATEEFCRIGTGGRPSCIGWTPGNLSGVRLDTPDSGLSSTYCEDPWCDISEPGHQCH
ncbi:Imm1 family immunity protein [Streptomyces sp. NPDC126522]|uniref:Imm1 family immunity protein n=1 Tax=Streptomyces sp. NPDC126522 TaxID=3155211 RepID=UPI0033321EE7